MSAWISMPSDTDAPPATREALERCRSPSGQVDNVMRVHGLRPQTMLGHRALYLSVLHDDGNTLPGWFAETVASYVSILNRCAYSLANHWANAAHLIGDGARADEIRAALDADMPESAFAGAELAMLRYARKLTLTPGEMLEADVTGMRDAGVSDEHILEVNQVVGYFCYVNRLLNGLGVSHADELVGYYVTAENGPSRKR